MSSAPGGQNGDWHSDSGTHVASFWTHKDFQDRVVWLWEQLAAHYKDNAWIAGYNPLNEPTDEKQIRVVDFYDRIYKSIRAIDPNHILFFDGNTFASDFTHFGQVVNTWENTAFSIHDYSLFGFPASPEKYVSSDAQTRRLERSYKKKREWLDQRGLCVWNGEWGPVYARREYDGDKTDEINQERLLVLRDQLGLYNAVNTKLKSL
jgi:Cellulase (glycosyl hydrolase family 5)